MLIDNQLRETQFNNVLSIISIYCLSFYCISRKL